MSEPTEPLETDEQRRAAGMRVRREVLGSAHVDRAVAAVTPLTADFQDFITRVAWGDLWQRPGLDRRTRSMLTLAITAALRHWDEFALHVKAAVNNGLTDEEIAEVCLHTAVYAGVPAANHALAVAKPILAELRAQG
jgi:4-carboxymuconolactone decarboxylase